MPYLEDNTEFTTPSALQDSDLLYGRRPSAPTDKEKNLSVPLSMLGGGGVWEEIFSHDFADNNAGSLDLTGFNTNYLRHKIIVANLITDPYYYNDCFIYPGNDTEFYQPGGSGTAPGNDIDTHSYRFQTSGVNYYNQTSRATIHLWDYFNKSSGDFRNYGEIDIYGKFGTSSWVIVAHYWGSDEYEREALVPGSSVLTRFRLINANNHDDPPDAPYVSGIVKVLAHTPSKGAV